MSYNIELEMLTMRLLALSFLATIFQLFWVGAILLAGALILSLYWYTNFHFVAKPLQLMILLFLDTIMVIIMSVNT